MDHADVFRRRAIERKQFSAFHPATGAPDKDAYIGHFDIVLGMSVVTHDKAWAKLWRGCRVIFHLYSAALSLLRGPRDRRFEKFRHTKESDITARPDHPRLRVGLAHYEIRRYRTPDPNLSLDDRGF